jgi:hypothetical protein
MKVQALKAIWTQNPERFWREGEILDLPDEIARQLLTNPNFTKPKVAKASKRGQKKQTNQ